MKTLLIITAVLGATGIALGAFGAHGLESKLSASQLHTWETAVKYQMIHILAIMVLGINFKNTDYYWPCLFFLLGILFFSGSLYLLSLKNIINLGSLSKIIGPITPIGGLFFIIGWLTLAFKFFKL